MANPNNPYVFANSFIQGFSFVDQIKRQKKADQRLEQRLKEDKEERAFQRRRTLENDRFVRQDRATAAEQRDQAKKDRESRIAGDEAAARGDDATDEELLPHVSFSPAARAEMERRWGKRRVREAIEGAQTIPTAGNQGASNRPSDIVTDEQRAQSPRLSDAVTQSPGVPGAGPSAQEGAALSAEANTQAGEAGFRFAPSRGRKGMEEVSEEEFNKFSAEYQDKGFFGKIGDVVAGQASQTVRAAEDVVGGVFNAPGRIRGAVTGEDINPAQQNTGQEFTGTVNLPGEFTTEAEFEEMRAAGASATDIKAAADKNFAITAEYEQRGRRPQSLSVDSYSRQGAVLQASDESRRLAIAEENRATRAAQDFINPATMSESQLGQLAVSDPRAATVRYLEMRATLQDTNIGLANEVDAAMLPVLDQAEADLVAEIQQMDPNTPGGRRALASLSNLQSSRDAIAKNQPSITKQAGINSAGLKVGDHPRVQSVADTIFDPDRVVETQFSGTQVSSAATVAGRISPNRRLNERQIDSLATLAQAGYIDKPTALSVMMTGAWPPGKDPNAIKKIQEAGGTVYAITEGGGYLVLQRSKGTGSVPNREIGDDQFKWVGEGIRMAFPNMEEGNVSQLSSILAENPGWVRSRFNVTSQEDMRKLGMIIAESKTMAGKKFAELEDGFLWFDGNTKEAPTVNQILMDPGMRDRLANEFEMSYIPLPEVKDLDGIDEELIRQNARDGRMGPTAAENADRYTKEQLMTVYARDRLMELDAAGRLEVHADGTYTILPPAQEQ